MDVSSSTSRTRPAMRAWWHRRPGSGPRPAAAGCGDSGRRPGHPDGPEHRDRRREVPPVRTRIVALAVLASVLATFLFAIPLGYAIREHLLGQESGYLVREASHVAIDVAEDVDTRSPVERDALTDVGDDDEHPTAAVFAEDGDLLAGSAPDRHVAVLEDALDGEVKSRIDDDLVVAAVPVTYGEDVIGAVLVTEPRSNVLREIALAWGAMAGLAAAAVTVTWLLARGQARRLARPLEDLEESARRLGDGDFSVRSHRGGIEELLTLARVGQRARDVPVEPLDLDALIGELSPEWGARLALHGRDLAVQVDPDAPHAGASGAAVRQVLGVLLDNAVTHGRGTVTVTVREAPGAVAVDVADEGPGVHDPADVLFAGHADRRDGHGIGLALARRLVEAEQGRLTLTRVSPPVFTLLLPTAVREDDAVPARQPGG